MAEKVDSDPDFAISEMLKNPLLLRFMKKIGKDPNHPLIHKLLDEYESLEGQNGSKRKMEEIDEGEGSQAKKACGGIEYQPIIPPIPTKRFTIKCVFAVKFPATYFGVMKSSREEHFGTKWYGSIQNRKDCLRHSLNLVCPLDSRRVVLAKYTKRIKLAGEVKTIERTALFGYNHENCFEEIKRDDGDYYDFGREGFVMEIDVEIINMWNVYKENLREFDVSMIEYSDVVFVVKEKKFYVDRKFLAIQSPYFDTMFSGRFPDATRKEVPLYGVDPDDFQNYLEVIYHHPTAIDEQTVEGILHVAHFSDTKSVTNYCEKFLMNSSEKSIRKLLELAVKYDLNDLKQKTLLKLESPQDVLEAKWISHISLHPIVAELFQEKLESFRNGPGAPEEPEVPEEPEGSEGSEGSEGPEELEEPEEPEEPEVDSAQKVETNWWTRLFPWYNPLAYLNPNI